MRFIDAVSRLLYNGHIVLFSLAFCGGAAADSVIDLLPGTTCVTVTRIPAMDCRAVRGFIGSPVDGSVKSWGYRGAVCEYPDTGEEGYDAGAGVDYSYNNNDGVHIALRDGDGFDAVVVRGGARTRLYGDVSRLTEPKNRDPLHEFIGDGEVECVTFDSRIRTGKISFFGRTGGYLSDAAFYRIERGVTPPKSVETWTSSGTHIELPEPQAKFAPESVIRAMCERYSPKDTRTVSLHPAANGDSDPILIRSNEALHFITQPFNERTGLNSIVMDFTASGDTFPVSLTAVVQDPLDPRLDLMWLVFRLDGPGKYSINLDFPDQVLLPSNRIWLTLLSDNDAALAGPDGGSPHFLLSFTDVSRALTEAVERRTFLLKHFFCILSETRPWGRYRKQSREEFYSGPRYERLCPELFMTIDQCHMLAPDNDMVRQYREWVFLRNLNKLSEVSPPPSPPEGVPDWAWYPRLAWLETRRIARWWLDKRLVPTGEFGGMVGDDSDLYQQFADLTYFETGGVAGRLKDGAARLAELADRENLRDGVNILVTDGLHAYEEGINHLALVSRWFYGDPVYFERTMESARTMERLTVLTQDGRRHFRNTRDLGFREIEQPQDPATDGGSNALLWHTSLHVADYNRNPRVMKTLNEWADTWLALMEPGRWATSVDVKSGNVLQFDKRSPLSGRAQANTMIWLYGISCDDRFVESYLYYLRDGETPGSSRAHLGDLYTLGLFDDFSESDIDRLAGFDPVMTFYRTGNPNRILDAVIGDPKSSSSAIRNLYDARRWPDMYTRAHQFTDRIFPSIQRYASVCFLGGYSGRNKFNPTHAVSWEGFGTEYGALVLKNSRTGLRAAVFNFAGEQREGIMRVWALEHGRYRVTVGRDDDGDFMIDGDPETNVAELARSDPVSVTFAPREVTIIDVEQVERLDPIVCRADLAITAREIEVYDGNISGVVHNIGSRDAENVMVSVIDSRGETMASTSVGSVPAPLDLKPIRMPFSLSMPGTAKDGFSIAVDPGNRIPEIYEGNNIVISKELPAADNARGRE